MSAPDKMSVPDTSTADKPARRGPKKGPVQRPPPDWTPAASDWAIDKVRLSQWQHVFQTSV